MCKIKNYRKNLEKIEKHKGEENIMKYGATQEQTTTQETTNNKYSVGWEKIFGNDNTTVIDDVKTQIIDASKNNPVYDESAVTPTSTTMQYQGMTKEELEDDYRTDVDIDENLDQQFKLSVVGKIVIAIYTAIMIGIFAVVIMNTKTLKSMAYVVDTKQDVLYVLQQEADDLNVVLDEAMNEQVIIEKAQQMGMEFAN